MVLDYKKPCPFNWGHIHIIPCHRVIRSDGTLGGFSAGLKWKRYLLALERETNKKQTEHRKI